jgi:hypothetical protein
MGSETKFPADYLAASIDAEWMQLTAFDAARLCQFLFTKALE